ncbi:MAG: amino acid ABC transporter substrate-binding protein [Anaerolineae bacterium]
MSRSFLRFAFLLVLLAFGAALLAACNSGAATQTAAPPTAAPASTSAPAAGNAKKIVIGFTTSQTGSLNVESTRQLHGLQLWLDNVQKAGGIKLKDGTVLMPDIKFYDDESKTDRVQQLYTKLINDDKVDFLISPYSSGLAKTAAVVTEQNGKVMVTTGAADDTTMEQGYKATFQLYTPGSRYLAGAIDLFQQLSPNSKNIAIVYETDAFSTGVAKAAQDYAKTKGYNIVLFEGYAGTTTDFAPLINKITAANPDAIIGGGHFDNGSTLTKQLYDKKVSVKMLALVVAPAEATFSKIGDGANNVLGPSQWEPQVTFTSATAQAANLPWYGIANADFISQYKAKFNEDPSYHSAGGYAAGLLLQKAIEDAGSTDPTAVTAAFDKFDLLTFFGHIKFSTDAKTHGKQVGHDMVLIQWQKAASGDLGKQIVFPLNAKTADAQLKQ